MALPALDVHRTTFKDLAQLAKEQGRVGYVGAADERGAGQVHYRNAGERDRKWNQNVRGETLTTENALIDKLHQGLPPVVRRTPQVRYRALFAKLAENALDCYRRFGYVQWPKSIEQELRVLAWKDGDPGLADYGGLDHVHKQIDALTRKYVGEGANKQREKDQRKVALDWHGHYSA